MSIGDVGLEVEVMGRGEPVLVIQTALDVDELRPLSQHLARTGEYQVFHYHRRGYAGSGPVLPPRSMADEAMDAGALVRALDVVPVHVVGASFSAAVALVLASRFPELVQTLAVVEPPPAGTDGTPEFREVARQLLENHHALGPQPALEQFMTMLVGPGWRGAAERELPGSVQAMERDAPTFFASDVPALVSWRFDATDAARVRCPVLCVGGAESSAWFTEMRGRLLDLLPQAVDASVEGAGHLAASTHVAEVAVLLRAHFRRHSRTTPAPHG